MEYAKRVIKDIDGYLKELESGEITRREFVGKVALMIAENDKRHLDIRKKMLDERGKMLEEYTGIYNERMSIYNDLSALYNLLSQFIAERDLTEDLDQYILSIIGGQTTAVN